MSWQAMTEAYRNASIPEGGGYRDMPDGTHQARLKKAEVKNNDDRFWISILWEDAAGTGLTVLQSLRLNADPIAMGWTKKELLALGFDQEELQALPAYLGHLARHQPVYTIKVLTKEVGEKKYRNVYIQPGAETNTDPLAAPVLDNSDIPF